jgi:ribosome-associated protein
METLPIQSAQEGEHPARPLAVQLAKWADERKAENIRLYEVQGLCSYADFILIASGTSERHVQALREFLRRQSKKSGHKVLGSEGQSAGQWLLMDYGDIVVHLFFEPVREYYDLDRLWSEAPRIPLEFHSNHLTSLGDDDFDDDYDDEDEDE